MNWSKLEPADRDALVAETIMGWTRHPDKMHPTDNRTIKGVLYCAPEFEGYNGGSGGHKNVVPPYSTSIADAMLVLEKFPQWDISKFDGYDVNIRSKNGESIARANGKNLTDLICLCALITRIQIED